MDAANDESRYAKLVAYETSLDLNIVKPDYEDFVKTIDDVVHTQEEPFGSPSMFMGWHVFKKAREMNCTVMLNGQGGDEVLLGYERYFASAISPKRPLKFISQIIYQSRNSRLSLIRTFANYFYFNFANLRIARLKKKSYVKSGCRSDKYFKYVRLSADAFNDPEQLQKFELSTQQLPHLLRYEDRNSMRHSIETRLPFLDYRLVEFAISLPLSIKIRNGWTKYILRKSCEGVLPYSIVWRKNKFGFEAPERIWLKNYHDQMLAEIGSSKLLEHYCDLNALKRNFSGVSLRDKWMYFNIARWETIYKVEIDPNER
jgi:asparagine synthase (glutamine-hydrolysing)